MKISFFKKVKTITSKTGELFFERWAIFEIQHFCALYIHRIHKSDRDPHLHTHPWNFVGLILKGAYIERTVEAVRLRSFGSISCAGRNFCHKIDEIVKGPVYSLFFVFGRHKPWYYSLGHVESTVYRRLKNENNLPQPDIIP